MLHKQNKKHWGKRGKMGMLSSLLNIPLNMPQNIIILTLLYVTTVYLWIKIAILNENNLKAWKQCKIKMDVLRDAVTRGKMGIWKQTVKRQNTAAIWCHNNCALGNGLCQGSPNYGPRAACGPQELIMRPTITLPEFFCVLLPLVDKIMCTSVCVFVCASL